MYRDAPATRLLVTTHQPFLLTQASPRLHNFCMFLSCSWVSSSATLLKFCFHYSCGETGLSRWHYPTTSMLYLKNLSSAEMLWTNFPIPQTFDWEWISHDVEFIDGSEQNQSVVSFNFSQDCQYRKRQLWHFKIPFCKKEMKYLL